MCLWSCDGGEVHMASVVEEVGVGYHVTNETIRCALVSGGVLEPVGVYRGQME